jgi:hypothetical protein
VGGKLRNPINHALRQFFGLVFQGFVACLGQSPSLVNGAAVGGLFGKSAGKDVVTGLVQIIAGFVDLEGADSYPAKGKNNLLARNALFHQVVGKCVTRCPLASSQPREVLLLDMVCRLKYYPSGAGCGRHYAVEESVPWMGGMSPP